MLVVALAVVVLDAPRLAVSDAVAVVVRLLDVVVDADFVEDWEERPVGTAVAVRVGRTDTVEHAEVEGDRVGGAEADRVGDAVADVEGRMLPVGVFVGLALAEPAELADRVVVGTELRVAVEDGDAERLAGALWVAEPVPVDDLVGCTVLDPIGVADVVRLAMLDAVGVLDALTDLVAAVLLDAVVVPEADLEGCEEVVSAGDAVVVRDSGADAVAVRDTATVRVKGALAEEVLDGGRLTVAAADEDAVFEGCIVRVGIFDGREDMEGHVDTEGGAL